jgi:hypothetical protein
MPWASALFHVVSPLVATYLTGRVRLFLTRLIHKPIYRSLPRPSGEGNYGGIGKHRSSDESILAHNFDASEQREVNAETYTPVRTEDEQTLRALEGYPPADQEERERREEERMRLLSLAMERAEVGEVSEDEEEELTATLISFDVEATESHEDSLGTWSAELRSANEPKPSKEIKYRVTALTMLPTIMATYMFKEVIADILTIPFEVVMVRIIGRSYARSDVSNIYEILDFRSVLPAAGNIFGVMALQCIISGGLWIGFTYAAQMLARKELVDDEDKENAPIS